MSKKSKYGNIDPEDLFRYLSDGLSEKERHAFEREIQKDLFLEEALEGYSTLSPDQGRKELAGLQSRINKRITGRSLRVWVPVAASVVVLLTLGTLYFTVFQDKISRMDQRVADSESVEEKREKSSPEERETPLKEEPKTFSKEEIEEREAGAIAQPAQAEILLADEEIEEPEEELVVEDEPIIAEENAVVEDSQVFALESETVADVSGAGEEFESEVLTTGEEFLTETAPATAMASRSSIAQPAPMDDRVLGTAKKQAAGSQEKGVPADRPVEDSIPATPVGGTELFDRYIEQNRRFPEGDTLPAGGTVVMSFTVDQQGRPGNIEIIETPADAFSREAVRLLQEGPEWTPVIINGIPVDRKIRLSIEFEKKTP